MTNYYLCDDSCEPMDIDALSVVDCLRPESMDSDWTYSSMEDLISHLERKVKELKWECSIP
jgi:hypothetical protein